MQIFVGTLAVTRGRYICHFAYLSGRQDKRCFTGIVLWQAAATSLSRDRHGDVRTQGPGGGRVNRCRWRVQSANPGHPTSLCHLSFTTNPPSLRVWGEAEGPDGS